MEQDKIYKFLFTERSVRGQWIRIKKTIEESCKQNNYPEAIVAQLSELAVVTSLFIANSKFEGEITFQIQGKGASTLLLVNGNHKQNLRAVARYDEEALNKLLKAKKTSLLDMVGEGVLVVSITPHQGNRYQSIVELKSTISESISDYYTQSMQIPTYVYFANQDKKAGAILLQYIPDGIGELADLEHLTALVATTTSDELLNLSANDMLYRLFNQEQVELFEPQEVMFKCTCNYDRSLDAVTSINKDEVMKIFTEEVDITTTCECCGFKYVITKEDYLANVKV